MLAICKDTVTVIGELSDEDLQVIGQQETTKQFASFRDILDKIHITGNKKGNDSNNGD